MSTLTVPYKVLAKGYTISGDVRSGFKASVPYLVAWRDAFVFADQVLGSAQAPTSGPISWVTPHLFPGASPAKLYAQRFTIEPCGADGSATPTKGLKPGEFFSHAIIKVEYETPQQTQQGGGQGDPGGKNQLDPENPITMCEQSVKIASKMETRKAGHYIWADAKPVVGDTAVLVCESKLSLNFPRVPYLPRKLIRPYIGAINSVPVLDSPKGCLLLEGMDTKVTAMSDGSIGQTVSLEFAESAQDFNMLPRPDGTTALVHKSGKADTDANRIYAYKDFRAIFQSMSFNG